MASELRKSIQPGWRMSCDLAHRLVVSEIYEAEQSKLTTSEGKNQTSQSVQHCPYELDGRYRMRRFLLIPPSISWIRNRTESDKLVGA